jgi:hypothetical protein
VTQEDQPHHGHEVFVARVIRIRAQIVRGIPQALFDCFDVFQLCRVFIVCDGTWFARSLSFTARIPDVDALALTIRPRRSHAHRNPDVRGGVDQAVEGEDVFALP